jgi:chromosome segregation ATPase
MWYCGQRNEEFAKVCRERDELKAELQKVIGEMHETKTDLDATKELLEAAKNAQGLLQIHLVKVQDGRDELSAALEGAKLSMKALNEKLVQVTAERDALEKIVGELSFNCDYCKHVGVLQGCGFDGPCWECVEQEKCVCGRCKCGSGFEYRGVETDHG